jgi:sodium-dependent dicarboxylate transporter 2/3/5
VFVGAAALWIFGDGLRPLIAPTVARLWPGFKLLGKHYEAGVALLAAAVLLLTGTVSRAQLARVPWGTLLLLGGSFALAAGIEGGGLSGFMTQRLEPVARLPLIAQLALVSTATVGLSAVASNTATVNVLLNVLPRSLPVLSACALAASCDFALPAGTPPNAIVFGSGYVRLPQMMRIGLALDALAAALITAYAYFYLRSVL